MLKRLFCGITITCIVLFSVAVGVSNALDDNFGRARTIEGRHFTIYYAPELELSSLVQKLNVRPSSELMAGSSSGKGFSFETELADMLDTLFTQVCDILDMQLYSFKGNFKICRDSNHLNYIYHQIFNNDPNNTTRSFYSFVNNTVYTSPENFRVGIVGHEIGHAIISHYFVVLPSVKVQEVLACYVEYQLRNAAQ